MIPGINVLNIAFGAIGQEVIQHVSATGRTQNAVGAWVTTYAAPVDVRASWQPAEDKKIEQQGLDVSKDYHSLWMRAPVAGVQRGATPDRFIAHERLHDVIDVKDWYGQDGWVEVMVIDVGAAP